MYTVVIKDAVVPQKDAFATEAEIVEFRSKHRVGFGRYSCIQHTPLPRNMG